LLAVSKGQLHAVLQEVYVHQQEGRVQLAGAEMNLAWTKLIVEKVLLTQQAAQTSSMVQARHWSKYSKRGTAQTTLWLTNTTRQHVSTSQSSDHVLSQSSVHVPVINTS
jgi:hypothetical protein